MLASLLFGFMGVCFVMGVKHKNNMIQKGLVMS